MFGYWEDISVAPGLSDFWGHRGFMCHVRKYTHTHTQTAAERLRLFAVQENVVWDMTHAELLHASHACSGARAAYELEF